LWRSEGGWDRTVRIWDPATWQQRATLEGHSGGVSVLVAAPDGRWLATAGRVNPNWIWI
jgi:WD40 repeat protein